MNENIFVKYKKHTQKLCTCMPGRGSPSNATPVYWFLSPYGKKTKNGSCFLPELLLRHELSIYLIKDVTKLCLLLFQGFKPYNPTRL